MKLAFFHRAINLRLKLKQKKERNPIHILFEISFLKKAFNRKYTIGLFTINIIRLHKKAQLLT